MSRQTFVVAVMITGVGTPSRLIGLSGRDLDRSAPGRPVVRRGLALDIGFSSPSVVHCVVVDDD
jgi:hypothetical protein